MKDLITRPRFYLDIIEEVEYLARKAGAETAERWHLALDQTIQQLLQRRNRPQLRTAGK